MQPHARGEFLRSALTAAPTKPPTASPTTPLPSQQPTRHPTVAPGDPTAAPTKPPTAAPSRQPTGQPTGNPTGAFAATIKIGMTQVFTTAMTSADFLSNAAATGAFENSIAVLLRVTKEKVKVTGATEKPAERVRRALTAGAGIVVEYEISVEIRDTKPTTLESAVAAVAVLLAAPSFTNDLAAAMAQVPSMPVVIAEPPDAPTVASATVTIVRTPRPSPAPTRAAESEQSTDEVEDDSAGSEVGLGVGAFVLLLLLSANALVKRQKVYVQGDDTDTADVLDMLPTVHRSGAPAYASASAKLEQSESDNLEEGAQSRDTTIESPAPAQAQA